MIHTAYFDISILIEASQLYIARMKVTKVVVEFVSGLIAGFTEVMELTGLRYGIYGCCGTYGRCAVG